MSFTAIINQARAKEIITGQLASGKVPHAYLFLGPEGVGRRKMALELAKTLNCLQPAGAAVFGGAAEPLRTAPCDHCVSCRKIDALAHPDVQMIDFDWQARFEEKEGKRPAKQRALKIDTIREIQREVSRKPMEGRWKVFIIDPAEKITPDAANCLLKTLEEPPRGNMIILLARHKENLPATIVSRVQIVPFGPLTDRDIAAWLILNAGLSNDDAHTVAGLAEGSLAAALKLVSDKKEVAEPLLSRVIQRGTSTASLLDISASYAKTADAFLDELLAEAKQQFRRAPRRFAPLVDDILRARRLLERHTNAQMVLDALLLRLNQRGM